jgi:hypothetical protein
LANKAVVAWCKGVRVVLKRVESTSTIKEKRKKECLKEEKRRKGVL